MTAARRDHLLYGLSVRSGLRLPGPQAHRTPDVELLPRSHGSGWPRPAGTGAEARDWFAHRTFPDGTSHLCWRGLFEFLISPDGRRIEWHRLPRASNEALRTYLLSQVLSFSLLARGREPLHASAVAVHGRVVAFVGDCGVGKSSLAAAFLRAGHPLVTDDLLVLSEEDGRCLVQPGIPRIKLYPRVARQLLGVRRTAPRMNPGTAKLVLPLSRSQSVRSALPLDRLYLLRRGPAVRIAPLSQGRAFLGILRATFNSIQVDRERLVRQFAFARRLAASVRVRRVSYPRRLGVIERVREAIIADLTQGA